MHFTLIRPGTKEICDISRRELLLFKATDKLLVKDTDYTNIDKSLSQIQGKIVQPLKHTLVRDASCFVLLSSIRPASRIKLFYIYWTILYICFSSCGLRTPRSESPVWLVNIAHHLALPPAIRARGVEVRTPESVFLPDPPDWKTTNLLKGSSWHG